MTTANPLTLADWLDAHSNGALDNKHQAAALLRTQHADLLRKDALLRQALGALREYAEYDHCVLLSDAITKELQ